MEAVYCYTLVQLTILYTYDDKERGVGHLMSMYCFIYGTIHTLFVPLLYYGTWVEVELVLDDWAGRPWSLLRSFDIIVRTSIIRLIVSLPE